jgi:2'-aminobiphenyl-2,3-diol 1,2-dioxygenase small subunit
MPGEDRYAVNRLVQELFANPDNLAQFKADRNALYDKYGLSAAQRAALEDGSPEALAGADMHPILQMHWAMASNPIVASWVSIRSFLPLGG